MPYTTSTLGGSNKTLTDMIDKGTVLERVQARRAERAQGLRAQQASDLAERKQELEEAKQAREERLEDEENAKREAAMEALPDMPPQDASPEEQVAWYNHAAATMSRAGYEDAAKEFREQGQQQYGQMITGPSDLETAEMDRGLTREQTAQQAALSEKTLAEADYITSGQKSADMRAGKAGKPPTVTQQINEDTVIGDVAGESIMNMHGLELEPILDVDGVDTGDEGPANLNVDNQRLYMDTYRQMIDELDGNVEEAKRIMEGGHKIVTGPPTGGYGGYLQDSGEQFIVPKGFIQQLQQQLGHAPSDEEIIANWKLNLGAFKAGA